MVLEKLGGVAIIIASVAGLVFVSVFDPPTFIQIAAALVGSFFCLIGIVIVFAETRIFTAKNRVKAPVEEPLKAGVTT